MQTAFSQKPAAHKSPEQAAAEESGAPPTDRNLTDEELAFGLKQFIDERVNVMQKLEV